MLWLLLLVVITVATLLQPIAGSRWPVSGRALSLGWLAMLPIGWLLLSGGLGLPPVSTRDWGGLTLTLVLTGASGLMALPLGILLALGRRSRLALPRLLSRVYIDGLRAVPLIAVLFFGQLLLPLFLPVEIEINRVLRAVTAFACSQPPTWRRMCGWLTGHPSHPDGSRTGLGPQSVANPTLGGAASGPAHRCAGPDQSGHWSAAKHQFDGDSGSR